MGAEDALSECLTVQARLAFENLVQESIEGSTAFFLLGIPGLRKRFVGEDQFLEFAVHSGNTCFRIRSASWSDKEGSWKVW